MSKLEKIAVALIAAFVLIPMGLGNWYFIHCINRYYDAGEHAVRVCNGGDYYWND